MAARTTSKHFLHDPAQLLNQALRSLVLTDPSLVLDEEQKVVRYLPRNTSQSSVSIISGGGAGHEPAFTSYVGHGLLSAAVSGTIFASPNAGQILHALENVDATQGILVSVMNYTGDVLNFGVAVERAKARRPNLPIEMLIIGDDVGVPRSQAGKVGRRGIAGTCLVHKILGAAAVCDRTLKELVSLGHELSDGLVSIGASLDRVHIPGKSSIPEDEQSVYADGVELGMGIHNEPGCGQRRGDRARLDVLVGEMLEQLLSSEDPERGFLKAKTSKAVLLINNLGGVSPLELGAITTEVTEQLHSTYKVVTPRIYSGTFMTSLNGPGFSISLLFLPQHSCKEIIKMLDFPTTARGWTGASGSEAWGHVGDPEAGAEPVSTPIQPQQLVHQVQHECDMHPIIARLERGLLAVVKSEPEITKFDDIVGDGDCGTTLKRGAEEILSVCHSAPQDIDKLLAEIVNAVERSMDGTSGALYSIFLNALRTWFLSSTETVVNQQFWIAAIVAATDALAKYTPATIGDRTLMDTLLPFQQALVAGQSLQKAADLASKAADDTKFLQAKLGRSVYVGGQDSWLGRVPDPGAWGLSQFLKGLSSDGESVENITTA